MVIQQYLKLIEILSNKHIVLCLFSLHAWPFKASKIVMRRDMSLITLDFISNIISEKKAPGFRR